jgi:hypothetical protein
MDGAGRCLAHRGLGDLLLRICRIVLRSEHLFWMVRRNDDRVGMQEIGDLVLFATSGEREDLANDRLVKRSLVGHARRIARTGRVLQSVKVVSRRFARPDAGGFNARKQTDGSRYLSYTYA